jgi:plastocyanin
MRAPMPKLVAGAVVCAVAVSLTVAGASGHDERKTVAAVGGAEFKVNESFTIGFKWDPDKIRVRSGDTVTWENRVDPRLAEPHTITIAEEDALPDTLDELLACGGPGTACEPAGGHFGPNDSVVNPVLNVGPDGLDQVGDSLFLPPPEGGNVPTVSAVISAPAGTELHYLCAIHPWMQGEIDVRRDRHRGDD